MVDFIEFFEFAISHRHCVAEVEALCDAEVLLEFTLNKEHVLLKVSGRNRRSELFEGMGRNSHNGATSLPNADCLST